MTSLAIGVGLNSLILQGGEPPELSVSAAIDGRDVTISAIWNGEGAPALTLTALTLDGIDVLADATGTGPWVYAVASSAFAQILAATVTPDGGDPVTRQIFIAPDLAAPALTASDSLAGRTLTITVDSLTGEPAPTATLTTLTLDGVNVLGDAVGTGPWTYDVPSSTSAQTVAWEVTAANGVAPDATANGSEVVAADQSIPDAAVEITGLTLVGGDLQIAFTADATWNGEALSNVQVFLSTDGLDFTLVQIGAGTTSPRTVPAASLTASPGGTQYVRITANYNATGFNSAADSIAIPPDADGYELAGGAETATELTNTVAAASLTTPDVDGWQTLTADGSGTAGAHQVVSIDRYRQMRVRLEVQAGWTYAGGRVLLRAHRPSGGSYPGLLISNRFPEDMVLAWDGFHTADYPAGNVVREFVVWAHDTSFEIAVTLDSPGAGEALTFRVSTQLMPEAIAYGDTAAIRTLSAGDVIWDAGLGLELACGAQVRRYADGRYAILPDEADPVAALYPTPVRIPEYVAGGTSFSTDADPFYLHGAMQNVGTPNPDGSIPQQQAWVGMRWQSNASTSTGGGGGQLAPYNSAYQVDPNAGNGGARMGGTLSAITKSRANPIRFTGSDNTNNAELSNVLNNDRCGMQVLTTFYVVQALPAAGDISPPTWHPTLTPLANVSDIDLTALPDLPTPAGHAAPTLELAESIALYSRAGAAHSSSNAGQSSHFAMVEGCYGREVNNFFSRVFGALISDEYTTAEREKLAIAVVKHGLDVGYKINTTTVANLDYRSGGANLVSLEFIVAAAALTGESNAVAAAGSQYVTHEQGTMQPVPDGVTYLLRGQAEEYVGYTPANIGIPNYQEWTNLAGLWTGNGAGGVTRGGDNEEAKNRALVGYAWICNKRWVQALFIHTVSGGPALLYNSDYLDTTDYLFGLYSGQNAVHPYAVANASKHPTGLYDYSNAGANDVIEPWQEALWAAERPKVGIARPKYKGLNSGTYVKGTGFSATVFANLEANARNVSAQILEAQQIHDPTYTSPRLPSATGYWAGATALRQFGLGDASRYYETGDAFETWNVLETEVLSGILDYSPALTVTDVSDQAPYSGRLLSAIGLSLASNGALTGTVTNPTTPGEFYESFWLRATDGSRTQDFEIRLRVDGAGATTFTAESSVEELTRSSTTMSGTITGADV